MRTLRALIALTIPASLALIAFLNARAVASLIEGTVSGSLLITEARAASPADASPFPKQENQKKSADAILDRNAFDHTTGPLRAREVAPGDARERDDDPRTAPLCEGVRPVIVVGDEDQSVAFASFDVGGRRVLRRRGGDVGSKRVAYVGRDRVWLEGPMGLCQAMLFGGAKAAEPTQGPAPQGVSRSPLETEVAKRVAKTGPNSFQIDRPTVNLILEGQQELMKVRITPDKDGDRILGMKVTAIKPGSVLATIGIENGDRLESINGFEVSNPERMLEAYARLRNADRLTVVLTRAGKRQNLDYEVR